MFVVIWRLLLYWTVGALWWLYKFSISVIHTHIVSAWNLLVTKDPADFTSSTVTRTKAQTYSSLWLSFQNLIVNRNQTVLGKLDIPSIRHWLSSNLSPIQPTVIKTLSSTGLRVTYYNTSLLNSNLYQLHNSEARPKLLYVLSISLSVSLHSLPNSSAVFKFGLYKFVW